MEMVDCEGYLIKKCAPVVMDMAEFHFNSFQVINWMLATKLDL